MKYRNDFIYAAIIILSLAGYVLPVPSSAQNAGTMAMDSDVLMMQANAH